MAVTLTKISSTTSSVTLEVWHNHSAGSRVYWDYLSGTTWLNRTYDLVSSGSYRQYTFTGLSSGTSYNFRVRVVNGSNLAELNSTTTYASTDSAPVAPSTPSGLSASAISQTAIDISWNNSSGAGYYELNMTYPYSSTATPSYASYRWTGLSSGTQYGFRVRAFSSTGLASGWSNTVYATTNSPPPPPSTPTGLTVSGISQTAVDISWNSGSNISYYELQMTSPSSGTVTPSSASYRWTGLAAGTQYAFRIRAVSNDGQYSGWSSNSYGSTNAPPVTATPTGFSLTTSSSSELQARWTAVSGATSYEVAIYSPTSSTYTSTTNSRLIGGLLSSTTYYAYVRAYSAAGGWSAWSAYSSAKTKAGRPASWVWHLSKTSNTAFNITASEWNTFCTRINAFRVDYKEISSYSFTTAYSANRFTAAQYNEARNAINGMNPSTAIPAFRSAGDVVNASDINTLRDSLNSI